MTSLAEIETLVAALPLEEQRSLLHRLATNVRAQESSGSLVERTPGLHRGQVWASEDFDDPLPDE